MSIFQEVDEDGNIMWFASSEGDGLCPVCAHAPDMHDDALAGCRFAIPDTYTHMVDTQLCQCPMTPGAPA